MNEESSIQGGVSIARITKLREREAAAYRKARPKSGAALEAAFHVALVNRGVLIAPFHNMMLVSPATTRAQVDHLIAAFGDIAAKLAA